MINIIINFFTPKDKKFYKILEEIASNVLLISEKLLQISVEKNKSKRKKYIIDVEALEEQNDHKTHEILILLEKNFITPFDREDIYTLAYVMDDICDNIYSATKKMALYKSDPTTSTINKFATLSLHSVKSIHRAIFNLKERKMNVQILRNCITEINRLENEASELFDKNIEKLFDLESNSIEIIKKKDIYQVLKDITDKCEDVGNVIERIMVKYI